MNTLEVSKYCLLIKQEWENKLSLSPLVKELEKQIKTIQDQGDQLRSRINVLEGHGKQLVKSSSEKECFNTFKTKRSFWRTC